MPPTTDAGDHLIETVADGVATLTNLNAAEHGSLGHLLDLEAQHMTRTFDTEDHRRAAEAFVSKRKPDFRGR